MSTTAADLTRPLDNLRWDNRFTRALPADPERTLRRRQVEHAAYSRVDPTPTAAPRLVAWSHELAEQLGLDEATVTSQDFADVFSGNRVPAGADPFAMAYAGHQFGNWAGQLGDGRAIALGEIIDRHGQHQMLQLKGAGPTPYSRTADGRAVLRSSLREFLCSEAMHHLGIPTTRALSLVLTGDLVVRDMLYDGNPAAELGAVVCRVAPSFTRFGNFQLPASRGDVDLLRQLVEHTIRHDFPELAPPEGSPITEATIGAWFDEVCTRTARLVTDWMRVGFVHGVLNTDNLSIVGLTIDYGPYGWLEDFDPDWTPNTTDAATRRYRYGQQPQVAHWNLLQLANALTPLFGEDLTPLQTAIDGYGERYRDGFQSMLAERLGWGAWRPGDEERTGLLFQALPQAEIDQVIFFRDLADVPVAEGASDDELLAPLADAWYDPTAIVGDARQALVDFLRAWGARVRDGGITDDIERTAAMDAVNPRYVLRNYLAQEAIDGIEQHDDPSLLHELHDVLRQPYTDQPGKDRFAAKRPEWARTRVGCSMLSCSS
ncbi:MAG: YdiU family protein [Actinomycetota bacterium]|nr:YdiU family protein [Actinomycetota bacterium]